MRLRRHFHTEEQTGIDLAPMLDFVMNLLIFFIITAVFSKELSLAVNRPGASSGESSGKDTGSIAVAIQPNGEIWVDQRTVDIRAVRANIERLHAIKPEWGVIVAADENADAGTLVTVLDQIKEGGVSNITFGTTASAKAAKKK
jgi:biopolymer transport protein ExbD